MLRYGFALLTDVFLLLWLSKYSTQPDCVQGVKTDLNNDVSDFTPLLDYCIKFLKVITLPSQTC